MTTRTEQNIRRAEALDRKAWRVLRRLQALAVDMQGQVWRTVDSDSKENAQEAREVNPDV